MSDLRALPYYKWFWQDWRANRKAQRMNYIERGLYRELLDECWVEGSIPNDLNILAEICGCPNDVMANAWQVLESCFKLVEDVYINEKMESLRTEKDTERLIKALNGKKGGVSKSLNIKEEIIKSKQVLASAKQVLASANIEEKRREEESIEEKRTTISVESKIPPCPHQEIISIYHDVLPELPRVVSWNKTREGYLKQRWRQMFVEFECKDTEDGLDWFRNDFFVFVKGSKFLTGKVVSKDRKPFLADLEWMIKPTNFTKIIERKYEN
jgi:uncharacterized protein YdaU (DUF1376 family)